MINAELVESINLSPSVRKLTLVTVPHTAFDWKPGQHITVHVPGGPDEGLPYSIASAMDPARPGRFELAVSLTSQGDILSRLRPSDTITLSRPAGDFVREPGETSGALFVAAGTGVAPLRAMIQGALQGTGQLPELVLLMGARQKDDLLFADEFSALERRAPNFSYEPTLSAPAASWQGRTGYVQAHLAQVAPPFLSAKAYVCGSTDMVRDCVRRLLRLGFDARNVLGEGY